MKRTAIVILNYNTENYLKSFLPAVLKSAGCGEDGSCGSSENEVIVADNASKDGSRKLLERDFPGLRTICFDSNLGFCGGYDEALHELEGQFSYYVLMNTDIEVRDGWLEPLTRWMDTHPECGACAPKLHSWRDNRVFEYAGAAGGLIDRFGYPFCRGRVLDMVEQDCGQYDALPNEVFWASGACLMVRSEVFHSLGGFDRRFFAHMEEIDLCWRMQLAGKSVCVVPQSTVYHIGGGTLPMGSPWKLQLNYRNNLLMLNNNLAKSIAAEKYRSCGRADVAAACGLRKAAVITGARMVLDGLSALVYLFTLRISSFTAVIKAHEEYRGLRTEMNEPELWNWVENRGNTAKLHGFYNGCIILKALLKKEKVFDEIHLQK